MSRTIRDHDGLGVTVTLERRDGTGDPRTVQVAHKSRREALRRAVAPFDPAEWRVVTVSTPSTIYQDLTCSRELVKERGDDPRGYSSRLRESHVRRVRSVEPYAIGGVIHPEPFMLGSAGVKAYL